MIKWNRLIAIKCKLYLALTSTKLIITTLEDSRHKLIPVRDTYQLVESYHSLQTTKLKIFKKTRRQAIKVCFSTVSIKYFELVQSEKNKVIHMYLLVPTYFNIPFNLKCCICKPYWHFCTFHLVLLAVMYHVKYKFIQSHDDPDAYLHAYLPR